MNPLRVPLAADTLVLFFSDNGGIPKVGSSNQPYRGAKLGIYVGDTWQKAGVAPYAKGRKAFKPPADWIIQAP